MAFVKPLSNNDIIKKLATLDIPIRFIPYHEMKNVGNLDDILPCILLYELHYPIGHWCLLFRNQEGINYFDSTGHYPDQLLSTQFDHPNGRVGMGCDFTYLINLMAKKGEPIVYNDKRLQPKGTSTCGYWSSVRMAFAKCPNDDFCQLFLKYPDDQREKLIVKLYNAI